MTSYDAIIVLGAAVWPDGRPSPALQRRILHAVGLFNAGTAYHLLLTGGLGRYPPSEAAVMQQLALDAGVPASHIVIEDQSHSTFDSAVSCRHILLQKGWQRILLITDRYHLPRALFTFRSLIINIVIAGSAPTDVQVAHPGRTSRQNGMIRLSAGRAERSKQLTAASYIVRMSRKKRWYRTYFRESLAFVWYVLRILSWKMRHPGCFT